MRCARFMAWATLVGVSFLLTACGGGGSGTSTSGDINPFVRAAAVATGLDRFLLYPNPVVSASGVFEVASAEYAVAYYQAIDPANTKDTVAKWKAANRIGDTSGGQEEYSVVIGDQRDLGYGRRMTAHKNPDGTMAFIVENYLAGGYGGYTPLSLEAAIKEVPQWHLGTNAIEFGPGPLAGTGGRPADGNFVKFYTFDPKTGERLNTLSLDGRPAKAMPTVCISCHGGRGDPLTPPDGTGKKLFALVMNSYSQHRGDVQAQLHPFEASAFDYSTIAGHRRSDLEGRIKEINKMVLCALPFPAGGVPIQPEDLCRRVAGFAEYQGTAAAHLKDMYGGDGLPLATSKTADTYVEASWTAAGQDGLYLNVVAPACRVCHLLRGTGFQNDISFETFGRFDSYKDRIKAHVVDRGNMPLAKLIYDRFRATVSMVQTMAAYLVGDLSGLGFNSGFSDGNLAPERPIADPGPDRVVLQGATTLSAAMSLYSSTYQWSIIGGPGGGASLSGATSRNPVFTATLDGLYTVQLIASNSTTSSASAQLRIKVDSALGYVPTLVTFGGAGGIKDTLQNGGGGCTGCHQPGGGPPILYISYDRAGTGGGTENSATNDNWFYTELRGRINFTDWIASPLLRKPSGHHHGGGQRAGFDTSAPVGDAARADYDKFVSWIVNGAPE